MPIETTFICEGCDARKTQSSADMPSYWAEAWIEVRGLTNWTSGGGDQIFRHRVLCPNCQITLAVRVDPRQWPRATKPGGD